MVLTSGFSTINTVIAAISRMVYGLAHNGQVPKLLMALHPTAKIPRVAFVAFSTCGLITLLTAGNGVSSLQLVISPVSTAWPWAARVAANLGQPNFCMRSMIRFS
jgi:amino acid transporter